MVLQYLIVQCRTIKSNAVAGVEDLLVSGILPVAGQAIGVDLGRRLGTGIILFILHNQPGLEDPAAFEHLLRDLGAHGHRQLGAMHVADIQIFLIEDRLRDGGPIHQGGVVNRIGASHQNRRVQRHRINPVLRLQPSTVGDQCIRIAAFRIRGQAHFNGVARAFRRIPHIGRLDGEDARLPIPELHRPVFQQNAGQLSAVDSK